MTEPFTDRTPTIEDLNDRLREALARSLTDYFAEIESVNGLFRSGDEVVRRILNLIDKCMDTANEMIVDASIQVRKRSNLPMEDILVQATAAMEVNIEELIERSEWRLGFQMKGDKSGGLERTILKRFEGFKWKIAQAQGRIETGMGYKAGHGDTTNTINAQSIVGNVQQGSPGAQATYIAPSEAAAAMALLEELERALAENSAVREVALSLEQVGILKQELASEQPKKGIIRGLLGSVRSMLEGAGGNILSTRIEGLINALSGLF